MAVERRAVLTWIAAGAAAVVAGCSRAAPARRPSSTTDAPAQPQTPGSPTGSAASSTPASASGSSTTPTTAAPGSPVEVRHYGPARQVTHGSRHGTDVALTFHGAGDPAIARELLAIFAAHRARVTVLAVGRWLHHNPDMAGEILAGGHELGNHTYHHLAIDDLSVREARSEIVRCRDVLTRLAGSPGAHFRQSQAQFATPRVRRLAGAAGYPVCLSYDLDSLDWTDPGPAAVRANVQRAQAGSIVSMHFGHRGTVQAMPAILSDLQGRGLRPVTAATMLARS